MDNVLRMEGIVKVFPGVIAVDRVSFELKRGEVHALLGHNGAGKSTLVKIIAGAYQRDGGDMYLDDRPVNFSSPRAAINSGIDMVYQELDLIPYLSGAENIFLGQNRFHNKWGLIDHRKKLEAAQEIVKRLDVEVDLTVPVTELGVSKQQIISIAKAISGNAKIIIFDEPTSALTESETQKLFEIMRWLTQAGVSLILITHRLNDVFAVADRVTIMRDGRKILVREVQHLGKREIILAMTDISTPRETSARAASRIKEPVLRCENLSHAPYFHDISLELRQGEVLGITGLIGCGSIEIARAIYGASSRDSGTVEVEGTQVKRGDPHDAARKSLAFVSDDRKRDGLILGASVARNMSITILDQITSLGFINRTAERLKVRRMINQFKIRISSEDQAVGTLSGGNQQKVVLSKWLLKQTKVLILCEPTRGIDIATKAEIHKMIRDLARSGLGVIVVSSEIDEILDTADRILVLYEGRMIGEVDYLDFDRPKLLQWMYGTK